MGMACSTQGETINLYNTWVVRHEDATSVGCQGRLGSSPVSYSGGPVTAPSLLQRFANDGLSDCD
jgi:hypothetical protein